MLPALVFHSLTGFAWPGKSTDVQKISFEDFKKIENIYLYDKPNMFLFTADNNCMFCQQQLPSFLAFTDQASIQEEYNVYYVDVNPIFPIQFENDNMIFNRPDIVEYVSKLGCESQETGPWTCAVISHPEQRCPATITGVKPLSSLNEWEKAACEERKYRRVTFDEYVSLAPDLEETVVFFTASPACPICSMYEPEWKRFVDDNSRSQKVLIVDVQALLDKSSGDYDKIKKYMVGMGCSEGAQLPLGMTFNGFKDGNKPIPTLVQTCTVKHVSQDCRASARPGVLTYDGIKEYAGTKTATRISDGSPC